MLCPTLMLQLLISVVQFQGFLMTKTVYFNDMFQVIDKCYCLLSTQILGTGFLIILLNLGRRQQGDVRYVIWSLQFVITKLLTVKIWLSIRKE